MENELSKAYAEVDIILSYMKNIYVEKIPKKLRELYKKEKLQGYTPNINPQISLDEQNLQKKTYAILAMLNLNYWCEDENERKELIAIYAENDRKKEEQLREQYNPDNLFKNRTSDTIQETERINENVAMVEYKESFIQKIINKMKKLFKRNKGEKI